jgi:hypothetical protein
MLQCTLEMLILFFAVLNREIFYANIKRCTERAETTSLPEEDVYFLEIR